MRNMILSFLILMSACGQNSSSKNTDTLTQNNSDNYSGIYEYVYPNNTPDLIENHFIVLTMDGSKLAGFYYGTSDEFDEAREGYLPSFFVAKMEDLKIISDSISFTLNVKNSDLLTQAIDLKYKSTYEALNAGFKNWENKISTLPRNYKGIFKDSKTIFFRGDQEYLNKTFKKK
jgi:hypothetical protein